MTKNFSEHTRRTTSGLTPLPTECPYEDCEWPVMSWKCRIWIDDSAEAKEWREKVKNGRWPVEKVSA